MSKRLPVLVAALSCAVLTAGILSRDTGGRSEPEGKVPSVKAVNYAEHIAPILNKHCVECHRPGEVAPFSLVGYENAKKRSAIVAVITETKRMPPWKAVHGFGEFEDENRLTPEQIQTLANWEKAGAPRGDKAKEPAPPKFSSEWPHGEPDMIASASKPFQLGAEGEDLYRNFVVKTDFKETKWVSAIAVRPSNPKVVHHVIAFIDEKGQAVKREAVTKDGQEGYSSQGGGVGFAPDGSFGGWAPGVRSKMSTGDVAFELKPGAAIVMQVHYHKSGKPETDQTKLGLYFAKKAPAKVLKLAWLANPLIRLKPGEKNQKVQLRVPIPVDVTVYGVMPHMHMLGRSMKAVVEMPDGSTKPLIYVDDWDFNWQLTYAFKQPVKVPKGSKIFIEGFYDNSSDNPNNPNDPPKMVTWGEQTADEMFLFVAAYTVDNANEEFNDRAALIKALFGGGN